MESQSQLSFAPQLYIRKGVKDISFYAKAFGAQEIRRWSNDDDTIHVAELLLGDLIFHLHEDNNKAELFHPGKYNGTTVILGLFVNDVDAVMKDAEAAGATVVFPAKDFEYGFRQGEIKDPFGHHWLIEKKI